jgi:hypothetical protein
MYESRWICHCWDFLGYIRGVYLYFLFFFSFFLSLRNVFCIYAIYYSTILSSSSLLERTTASPPLVPLTLTDARVPQVPYCEFPHRPLLRPSYPAEYSLLAPLRRSANDLTTSEKRAFHDCNSSTRSSRALDPSIVLAPSSPLSEQHIRTP